MIREISPVHITGRKGAVTWRATVTRIQIDERFVVVIAAALLVLEVGSVLFRLF